MTSRQHLFVFGPGYSAWPFMERAKAAGFIVSASYRRPESREKLERSGFIPLDINDSLADILSAMPSSHILQSAPPDERGDPLLSLPKISQFFAENNALTWIGYLSATNVYGDHQGRLVDEKTPATPSLTRGKNRLKAERQWQDLVQNISAKTADQTILKKTADAEATKTNKAADRPRLQIFRLAGIYGPGRNALRQLLDGKAKSIYKKGHVFSRIHRDDIAEALWLGATGDSASGIYNMADDKPMPSHELIEQAAHYLGLPVPPREDFETAQLSPMARSFYADNKIISNLKIKQLLGLRLRYPNVENAFEMLLNFEKNR